MKMSKLTGILVVVTTLIIALVTTPVFALTSCPLTAPTGGGPAICATDSTGVTLPTFYTTLPAISFSVPIPAPRADQFDGYIGEEVQPRYCGNGNGVSAPYVLPFPTKTAFCGSQQPVYIPITGMYQIYATAIVGNYDSYNYALMGHINKNGNSVASFQQTFVCSGGGCFVALNVSYQGYFMVGDSVTMSITCPAVCGNYMYINGNIQVISLWQGGF